ncbi:MAG: hypothetical protein QM296_03115 [Bacillota bacterium]|nr:hypothetical protein [Bacillota bacterium]
MHVLEPSHEMVFSALPGWVEKKGPSSSTVAMTFSGALAETQAARRAPEEWPAM